jgi:oligopeptide/dipeptide ABC transporter ATP-binding protein
MTGDLVAIERLSVGYAQRAALAVRDVSMSVAPGEFHGLVGESGSGKSTVARAVLGLTARGGSIKGGRVLLDGTDLVRLPARRLRQLRGAKVGYVGQNPFGALHPVISIGAQFELVRRAHRGVLGRAAGRARALALLEQVGIREPESVLRGYVHQLSGGMAQRIVIALALYLEPRLIVADEPTTGLDVTVQRQILDLLTGQAQLRGMGLLLVTHDLGVVAQYCENVTVLYGGRVMEAGPVTGVLTDPRHPYTQALIAAVPTRGQPLRYTAASNHPVIDAGCPFRERCALARPDCGQPPPAVGISAGWQANCHGLGQADVSCAC